MGLAPAGGKLIAQIIAGQQPDMDIAPFAVGRYARRPGGRTRRAKSGRRR
jgi:D-amino-acid dehydrogenase